MTRQGSLVGVRALPFGATLSFAVCMGLLPPHALGALSPFLIPDLDISRALYGTLGTAVFASAALLSPVAGEYVDRVGARRALMSLFAIATIATASFGLAVGYWMLLAAVCLGGAATALANPSATSMVLQAAPTRRRARFLGIAQTGPPLAALIAGFVLPLGAVQLGWRPSLVLVAAAAMCGVLSTYLFMPRRGLHNPAFPPSGSQRPPRIRVGSRRDWPMGAYAFLMNIAIVPVTVYAPLYAFQQLEWTQARAALLTGLLGVSSLIGRLVWSSGSATHAHTVTRRLTLLPIVSAAALTVILVAAPVGAGWMLWIGVATFGASALAWTVLTMLAVLVRSSTAAGGAGRSAGSVMLFGFLGGAVGPLMFGLLVDATGSYTPAWAVGLLALCTNVGLSRAITVSDTA